MKTEWCKPQFHLSDLSILVALLAVVFAVLPAWGSPGVAFMVVVMAILRSCSKRISTVEWLILVAITGVLFCLTMPAVQTNCGAGKRLAPAAPMAPGTVGLPIPTP